jgi:hypothetical protein
MSNITQDPSKIRNIAIIAHVEAYETPPSAGFSSLRAKNTIFARAALPESEVTS